MASGQVEVALVVGVEKFSDVIGSAVDAALATISDSGAPALDPGAAVPTLERGREVTGPNARFARLGECGM